MKDTEEDYKKDLAKFEKGELGKYFQQNFENLSLGDALFVIEEYPMVRVPRFLEEKTDEKKEDIKKTGYLIINDNEIIQIYNTQFPEDRKERNKE